MSLTQERLKELLKYNPETGVFTRLISNSNATKSSIGKPVGFLHPKGYLVVKLDGGSYLLHRLAFLYMTGKMPNAVEHIDGDLSNNIFSNLREAICLTNKHNCKIQRNNQSGIKGIHIEGSRVKRYRATVVKEKVQCRKSFASLEEATVWVRHTREQLYGGFVNHG